MAYAGQTITNPVSGETITFTRVCRRHRTASTSPST